MYLKMMLAHHNCVSWLPPTMQNVRFAPIAEIDFTAPSTKRKRQSMCAESQERISQSPRTSVPAPTNEELATFHEALSKTGKPALLSLHLKYSDAYILDHTKLSTPLSSLFNERCSELLYPELLVECEKAFE